MTKFAIASLLILTCAVSGACTKHEAPTSTAPSAAAPKAQPTDARVRERAQERMDLIAKRDWVAAYDFHSAEGRRVVALSDFLTKKDHHRFDNPKVQEVLQNDGKQAFVRVTAQWTPTHPKLKDVELPPGASLTQDIEQYQTWVWSEGDWMYFRVQTPEEFYAERPEMLNKPKVGAADPAAQPAASALAQPAEGTPPK